MTSLHVVSVSDLPANQQVYLVRLERNQEPVVMQVSNMPHPQVQAVLQTAKL